VFFQDVLSEAHAVALVGGTLRPFVHVATELLGEENHDLIQYVAKADEEITLQTSPSPHQQQRSQRFSVPGFAAFTCDHVVPASNVLLQLVSTGPSGLTFDFRHGSRFRDAICDELGSTLLRVCRTVPNGVVIFLPSYSYEVRNVVLLIHLTHFSVPSLVI